MLVTYANGKTREFPEADKYVLQDNEWFHIINGMRIVAYVRANLVLSIEGVI